MALLAGCATSQQAPPVQHSGFLDDYSIMRPGVKDEAGLVYEYPLSNGRTFNKLIVAPVVVLQPVGKGLPEADRQRLATNFWLLLRQELGKNYRLVEMAGPNTLRIQAATGEHTSVGETATDLAEREAMSNERLVAAVDRRAGKKGPFRGQYKGAHEAFVYWSELIRMRLDEARGVTGN